MARSAKPQRPGGPLFDPFRVKKSFARARTIFIALASLLLLLSPAAPAAEAPPPEDPQPASPAPRPRLPSRPADAAITSADRRFRVVGLSSAENLRLAETLSALSRALETRTGVPVPFRRGDPPISIQIPVSPDASADWLPVQSFADGFLDQRLATPPPVAIDPEDLAARVVSLLLTRCTVLARPPSSSARPAEPSPPPDWLSAGLAQLLNPATLARDRAFLRDAPSAPPPLSTVLSWAALPDGRWADKAYAAAAADAAFPPSTPALWRAYFRAAALAPVPPSWFLQNTSLPPPADWPSALARWAAPATADPDSPTTAFDPDDPDGTAERRLVQTLSFRPADWLSPPPGDLPETLFAADLLDYPDAPWAPPLASALALHVQSLALGTTADFQSVLSAYAAYFDALSAPPAPTKPHWWSRQKETPPSDPARLTHLRSLWTRAETAHRTWLSRRQSLRDYVTSWEHLTASPASPPPAPPRTPTHLYLDAFDSPPF